MTDNFAWVGINLRKFFEEWLVFGGLFTCFLFETFDATFRGHDFNDYTVCIFYYGDNGFHVDLVASVVLHRYLQCYGIIWVL